MINAFKAASSPTLQWHFIDDWDTYHLGLGEVHCGTNVRRTPTASWWTTAQHLMGSN
jgi:protein-arginine deiminase